LRAGGADYNIWRYGARPPAAIQYVKMFATTAFTLQTMLAHRLRRPLALLQLSSPAKKKRRASGPSRRISNCPRARKFTHHIAGNRVTVRGERQKRRHRPRRRSMRHASPGNLADCLSAWSMPPSAGAHARAWPCTRVFRWAVCEDQQSVPFIIGVISCRDRAERRCGCGGPDGNQRHYHFTNRDWIFADARQLGIGSVILQVTPHRGAGESEVEIGKQ